MDYWIKSGQPGTLIPAELGISYPSLKDWKARYNGGVLPQRATLEAENRILRRERAFLAGPADEACPRRNDVRFLRNHRGWGCQLVADVILGGDMWRMALRCCQWWNRWQQSRARPAFDDGRSLSPLPRERGNPSPPSTQSASGSTDDDPPITARNLENATERLRDAGLIPAEGINHSVILVESAEMNASLLLTTDHHLRGVDYLHLKFLLERFDLPLPVITAPVKS